jgi:hypothetical protein
MNTHSGQDGPARAAAPVALGRKTQIFTHPPMVWIRSVSTVPSLPSPTAPGFNPPQLATSIVTAQSTNPAPNPKYIAIR